MKLTVLGSNSKGNSYILEAKGETLLIEAGIHLKELKKELNFNLKNIVGCVVSHSHL